MGYVREPEGVDFVINGKPLTEKQKLALSEYIREDKKRAAKSGTAPAGKAKGKRVGYVKEPEGVDFVIKSEPLDDKAGKEISEYIKAHKARQGAAVPTKSTTGAVGTAVVAKKGTKKRVKAAK